MKKVTLTFKKSNHINQYIYGFLLLNKQKIIKIDKINKDSNIASIQHILRAEIDGRKIVYDANDGDHLERNFFSLSDYEWCDLYFKRSLSEQLLCNYPKCRPLGFNYNLKPAYRRIEHFLGNIRRQLGKEIIRHYDLEVSPYISDNPKILFLTRLWEPNSKTENSSEKQKITHEINALNEQRLMILKTIKSHFSSIATIGLNDSEYSRKMAPDFILPATHTNRRNFIDMIKNHEICITSTGLHRSTGWRFGEFVAAARAIISEPLEYIVPGDFSNYLTFKNEDELISAIDKLTHDKELRYKMMTDNEIYYNEHLKPDKLILNTLLSS
ncbi:hypothetical protein Xvie_03982 [Xenorhabdus vietnamensis]|uniref:Glycosyltransferase family 1 protein n=1 Tax=Xenorhabdus vietnamensis TaxID=351656 RepID=A0A1Y2S872_9GAMM|nr:hypothetical protein [Xenorhabdus vietnamensis]OTA14120.1 hypothetical protein Xvie_03982 [Xenorhabdus vietnamensis]